MATRQPLCRGQATHTQGLAEEAPGQVPGERSFVPPRPIQIPQRAPQRSCTNTHKAACLVTGEGCKRQAATPISTCTHEEECVSVHHCRSTHMLWGLPAYDPRAPFARGVQKHWQWQASCDSQDSKAKAQSNLVSTTHSSAACTAGLTLIWAMLFLSLRSSPTHNTLAYIASLHTPLWCPNPKVHTQTHA